MMINNPLIQLIIRNVNKSLDIFCVMKHTILWVFIFLHFILDIFKWLVVAVQHDRMNLLFLFKSISSVRRFRRLESCSQASKLMENDEDAIEESESEPEWAEETQGEKKVWNYRRHWDVISFSSFTSLSLSCCFRHSFTGKKTAGYNNMSEQRMSMVNEPAHHNDDDDDDIKVENRTACLFLHAQLCSSSINYKWMIT